MSPNPKAPLLLHAGGRLLSRRNSVDSFISNLPHKLLSGVVDLESPFHIDFSRTRGLSRGEKEYYKRQLETLKSFDEVDSVVASDIVDMGDLDEERILVEKSMKFSTYADVLLLALKMYAAGKSRSSTIAASTLDSLLELMASGILWFTHLSMKNVNIHKYPIGKLRLQRLGIIIFAVVMATFGCQVLTDAVEVLIKDEASAKLTYDQIVWLLIIMMFTTVTKLVLWIYCKYSGSIVHAYAKDHYFVQNRRKVMATSSLHALYRPGRDTVVTNIVGFVAPVLGDQIFWWIDPVGAIVLAVYTIINWSGTVIENAVTLIGKSAPPEVLQKITYLVINHPGVKRIDTLRAYTFALLYFVEVDIELPEELPLKEAHTIGESLQVNLEKLPEVERAFVHLDVECDHRPEHSVFTKLPNSLH